MEEADLAEHRPDPAHLEMHPLDGLPAARGILRQQLAGREWIMGDEYTIADISMLGWVRNLIGFYEARDLVGFDALRNVPAWLERGLARPAVQRGLAIPKRG